MQRHWNGYELTDDPARLDFETVYGLLADTYWAAGRPREMQQQAFAHSTCFSVFHSGRQVAFARVVSDFATFAWLADVIVHPDHRGRGVGPWMVQTLLEHPALATRSQWLATLDAHGLYEKFGFVRFEAMRKGPPHPGAPVPTPGPSPA